MWAIAEQHALTLAAGLACEGLKPVVAIYPPFYSAPRPAGARHLYSKTRCHLAIDRAGLVGKTAPPTRAIWI